MKNESDKSGATDAAPRDRYRAPRSARLLHRRAVGRALRARAGRRPRALPAGEDQLAPGRGRRDHRRGDPASYFDNLIAIAPQFEALTGVKVRFEKVPPGQIRQKAMLDLSSKTATYATHAADPMYYPLYVVEQVGRPLDRYLNDAKLTDTAWFNYDDIFKAWRDADSVDGKLYGIPYDGEVTVQVYRKDLYDAKGLKPADTLDEFVKNAAALHDPANRV